MLLCGSYEPRSYDQAVKEKAWEQAMRNEIDTIEKNNTWRLEELPPGHKLIGLKWVYKVQRNTDGEIIKHKARIVAKRYVQRQGVDFEESFRPCHPSRNNKASLGTYNKELVGGTSPMT